MISLLLALLSPARAETFVLGVEGNIASDDVFLLMAPEDHWFTGNGGGALSFEWRPSETVDSSAGLALAAGWNYGGGLTIEGDWRLRSRLSRAVTLVTDPVGISLGGGIFSPSNEARLLIVVGGGIELPIMHGLDLSLVGKIGMGAARDERHGWFGTNTTSAYLRLSHTL